MHREVLTLPSHLAGLRLDKALAILIPDLSRERLHKGIVDGFVRLIDAPHKALKPTIKVKGGETLTINLPNEAKLLDAPEDMPITVVYEDNDILVINKSAGLTVHPGNGQRDHTLLNALLFHRPLLSGVARAGIVHRLDKDTSGLMVIAKNTASRLALMTMIADRRVSREYLALVKGAVACDGTITAPIGRHPTNRTKMAVMSGAISSDSDMKIEADDDDFDEEIDINLPHAVERKTRMKGVFSGLGRFARTHYKVVAHYPVDNPTYSLLHCKLDTGRTHQIRVHLSHIGHPLVGDNVYRGKEEGLQLDKMMGRQALHAFSLGIPPLGDPLADATAIRRFQVPLPSDFQTVINILKKNGKD